MVQATCRYVVRAAMAGVAVFGLLAVGARAAEPRWQTLLTKARGEARADDKLILMNFTGSDWCPYCAELKREVFNSPAFAEWAEKNVVLLELDFPRKGKQSTVVKNQNERLKKQLKVEGFPTVVVVDSEGEEVGRIPGYSSGRSDAWLEQAQGIVRSRPFLRTAESLEAAMREAKQDEKPLMLVVANSKNSDSVAKTGKLTKDRELIALANMRLVTVLLQAPDDLRGDNLDRRRELIKTFSLPDGLDNVAVIDLVGNKVIYQSAELPAAAAVVKPVKAALPPMKYDGTWLEDFAKAQTLAAEMKRPMLLDFTGSDWCGWCIKLDREIFSTPTFQDYARKNLILVKLDFPRSRKMDPTVVAQNQKLASKYKVNGYPTVIVLDPSGNQVGQMGYMSGGPEPFLQKLKGVLGSKRGQ
ncbi:MAG: thioredoxin family protein [Planctomycetes bacterium]|nr:thioredoxin family protein [Planctomycetota bacterium]